MKLASSSFSDGAAIPAEFAFCAPDAKTHATLSANRNPHLAWSAAPGGVKSFAIVCHDPDVPSKGDDVNQEGRFVPASLARVDFFHWVIVDLPAATAGVKAGEFSSSVVPRGKPGPQAPHGARQGINDYTKWFAGDQDMAGDYYGYDGPCPPWNDERAHRYVFTVYALDVARLPVEGAFGGEAVRKAVRGHVLAEAAITGRYALNPAVKAREDPAAGMKGHARATRRDFVFGALALAVAPGARDDDEVNWDRLRRGGLVLLMRHAATGSTLGDPPGFRLDDCATQRNLSAQGREEAKRAGAHLRERRVPIARVYTSPWCRCRETAMLAFGRAEEWDPLSSVFDMPGREAEFTERVKRRVAGYARRNPGGNVVMVTHNVNIAALTRRSIATAEIVVARPDGCCGMRPLERIKP